MDPRHPRHPRRARRPCPIRAWLQQRCRLVTVLANQVREQALTTTVDPVWMPAGIRRPSIDVIAAITSDDYLPQLADQLAGLSRTVNLGLGQRHTGGVGERGHQMRGCGIACAGPAHGLAVQCDHQSATDGVDAQPEPGAADQGEQFRVERFDHATQRGFARHCATQSERVQDLGSDIGGVLRDRPYRLRSGRGSFERVWTLTPTSSLQGPRPHITPRRDHLVTQSYHDFDGTLARQAQL